MMNEMNEDLYKMWMNFKNTNEKLNEITEYKGGIQ
jgi:hypothetical protein